MCAGMTTRNAGELLSVCAHVMLITNVFLIFQVKNFVNVVSLLDFKIRSLMKAVVNRLVAHVGVRVTRLLDILRAIHS